MGVFFYMENDAEIKKRFAELYNRARQGNYYIFTDFCSPADAQAAYEEAAKQEGGGHGGAPMGLKAWGGREDCERLMLRFGDPRDIGYEEEYPIRIVRIAPKAAKFAEQLTHRDFLGAVMNLGIERSAVGDILVHENVAYAYVVERLSNYIVESLDRVRHTAVVCEVIDELPAEAAPDIVRVSLNVPALRLDCIVARLFGLSREKAKNLFSSGHVSLGGRECTSPDRSPAEGDIVSVRGFGKFVFYEATGETKKGRLNVDVGRYGTGK